MPGPPPKPSAVREAEGNPGKKPMNTREPQLPRVEKNELQPPEFLLEDEVAAGEWRRLAPRLWDLGLLTIVDLTPFAVYCAHYSRWRRALKETETEGVVETPKGFLQTNPWDSQMRLHSAAMQKLAAQFGFMPASRTKVQVPAGPEESDGEKEMFG